MAFSNLNLWLAREADLESLIAIEIDCFADPWPQQELRKEILRTNSRVEVVACPAFGIIAYSCAWKVAHEFQLLRIGTRPQFRGGGAAQALLCSLIDCAEKTGCELIQLEVAEQNYPAVCLYKKLGFIQVGMRKNYYRSPPDHALLMVRLLDRYP